MKKEAIYKTETVPLELDYNGRHYRGQAVPVRSSCSQEVCFELDVTLNGERLGHIYCGKNMQWRLEGAADQLLVDKNQLLVDKIGQEILLWYE